MITIGSGPFIGWCIFFSIVALLGVYMIIRTIRRRNRLDSDEVFGNIVLMLVFFGIAGGGGYSCYSNALHKIEQTDTIYPEQCKLMFDDEEIVVKHAKFRFTITDHKEYLQVLDSNFYVIEKTLYNYERDVLDTQLDFVTYDDGETNDGPIPIEL